MPDLDIRITGVEAGLHGLVPLLNFRLEVAATPAEQPVHSVMLQAQIQFQVTQRRYTANEKEKLVELFGAPERWGSTLRTKLWTIAHTNVPAFTGTAKAALTVPCTFDLNVAAAKYFYALETGDVPLLFLFSGTVFYEGANGALQVQQISWNKECPFKLPVKVWQELMDQHFPNTGWLTVSRETLERLYAYRRAHGLVDWDQTLSQLLTAPALDTTGAAA